MGVSNGLRAENTMSGRVHLVMHNKFPTRDRNDLIAPSFHRQPRIDRLTHVHQREGHIVNKMPTGPAVKYPQLLFFLSSCTDSV